MSVGDRVTMTRPRMTPQQRIRAAKELFHSAKSQPNLPPALRAELRRVAANLVACNRIDAARQKELLPQAPHSLKKNNDCEN